MSDTILKTLANRWRQRPKRTILVPLLSTAQL